MLLFSRRRQDFFSLFRVLALLSTSRLLSFCNSLDCVLSPYWWSPLQSSCTYGTRSSSCASPFICNWPSLSCLFRVRGFEGPYPPYQLRNGRWRSLPAAAVASVEEVSVLSSFIPSYKRIPIFAVAAASPASTGDLLPPATLSAPATSSDSSVYVYRRARGRHQASRLTACLEHPLPSRSTCFLFRKGSKFPSSLTAGAVSTSSLLLRSVCCSPPAVHSVCVDVQKQQGLALLSTHTLTAKQWAASRDEAREPLQSSRRKELCRGPAMKMTPTMAVPAVKAAASAAFLFHGRGVERPLAAAVVSRHVTCHDVARSTPCEFPAASARSRVTLAATFNSSIFPAPAAALAWNAFIATAASHCGDCITRRAIIASTWRSSATAGRFLSTPTPLQQSSTEASSSFALQQQYQQRHQRHRWTSVLAHNLGRIRDWQGSPTSLRRQTLQLSFSSPSYCFNVAAGNGPGRAGKQRRTTVHAKAAAAKGSEATAASYKDDPAAVARPYAASVGLKSHPGASAASASAAGANVGGNATAGAIDKSRPHHALQQHSDSQHARRFTHTKQIATIGPASWDYEEIERLFLSGIDVFRLNLSHGLLHEKHQQLQHVRSVEQKYGHPIAVLADLPGPKLRLGSFEGDDAIYLPTGATFIIDNASNVLGNQQRVALPQNEEVLQVLRTGDVLLLDDGKLKLQVIRQLSCSKETYQQTLQQKEESREKQAQHIEESQQQCEQPQRQHEQERGKCQELQQQREHIGPEEQHSQVPLSTASFPDRVVGVECVVLVGGSLSGKKGVNIPSATLPISALSARDRELARLVAGWGVDWIALSFVQRAEDVRELRRELHAQAQLLATDTSGVSDSTSASKSSSRILRTSTDSDISLRKSKRTSETVEQPVYNEEQPMPPVPVQKHQPNGHQQEKEDDETGMEQQRRLLSLMKSHEESFSSFAPSHARRGGEIAVIVKIEKPLALENIEEILEEADALMVARGDLGVELAEHAAWLPVVQKRLVKLCQEAGKPVVIATQMLDSMTHAPAPTRAELTDVANAVYDGADAVMLSGETAAGAAPARVAQTQYEGIQAVESDPHFWRQQSTTRRLLVDKKAARAASCFAVEMRSSRAESNGSAHAHEDDRGSRETAEARGEQHSVAAGAAAPAGGEASVAPSGYTEAAGPTEEIAGNLRRPLRGERREEAEEGRREQIGRVLHEQQGSEPSAGNHEEYIGLESSLCAGRARLFPEFREWRLPWKRQRTRISELPLGGQKAGDHATVARRAAAALAATSFYEDRPEVGSGHTSHRSRGSKTRGSRIRTAVHPPADMGIPATKLKNYSETGGANWAAAAAEQASRLSGATSIVVFEETGDIARHLAALRPAVPVVAVTPSAYVARELQLHWGIYPVVDTTIWKAADDTRDRAGGGERAAVQGQSERRSEEERTSQTVGAPCTENEATRTSVEAGITAGAWEKALEIGNGRVKAQMGEVERPWRGLELPFCTQISRAAALLVEEGMASVDGDENVVVVGGFYTPKGETVEESKQIERTPIFLPQISVSRIRTFL